MRLTAVIGGVWVVGAEEKTAAPSVNLTAVAL
jgi:hypothetical protein